MDLKCLHTQTYDVQKVLVNTPQPLEDRDRRDAQKVQSAFGKHLRKLRAEKHQTTEHVAEVAGIHPNYLSSVERGERNLGLFNIWRIAQALNVPASELLVALPVGKKSRL